MQDCVILAGIGCGTPDTMTAEVRDSISGAEIWIGGRRILSGLPDGQAEKFAATKPGEILTALLENRGRRCCVLYSGDSGFYSGARSLAPLLEEQGIGYRIVLGISGVQALAARRGVTLADTACDTARYKEEQYDLLADTVRRALDMEYIYRILEGNG